MRNVIFPTFSPARCEGRTFLESAAMWGWRIHPWMNRRYDWAIIPRQGTRNFRNKEAGATRRDAPVQPTTKLAYEVHLRVRNVCPRECASWKFRCFEALRTRPSTIFRDATEGDRAYLRYYVENIQHGRILRGKKNRTRYSGLTIW